MKELKKSLDVLLKTHKNSKSKNVVSQVSDRLNIISKNTDKINKICNDYIKTNKLTGLDASKASDLANDYIIKFSNPR